MGLCGKILACYLMQLTQKTQVTRYVKLARYVKVSVYKHDRAQSGTTPSGSIYYASCGKTCAGTILPSFEHNWLKWSCDSYSTQRHFVEV